MALYDDGKTRFSNEFIDQFKDEGIRSFLRSLRYNLVNSIRSKYCTVENLLYNKSVEDITDDLYQYLCGWYRQSEKNYVQIMARNVVLVDELKVILKGIYTQMCIDNNWDE